MLFNSAQFIIFFPICIGLYYVMPKRLRTFWLLLSSLYFYMCWNVTYVLLLLTSIVVTYLSGILINKVNKEAEDSGTKTLAVEASNSATLVDANDCSDEMKLSVRHAESRKKVIVVVSLVINLGILFSFKYLDFIIESINVCGRTIGDWQDLPLTNLLLPVGISFYTFQAIGYTIDVYRGKVCERNFIKYALFVSFFPQLVAGPIERSENLLSQINRLPRETLFNKEDFVKGFLIMVYGYFMKLMVADRAAIFVNSVFEGETISLYGGALILVAAVLFSFQIYCDFAGYTYIAIGAARMMGIKLCDNFNTPYLSVNLKDFWDRWHMSLSTWFRDYLYFPLGGSRKGNKRKYINILIVFLVSGLWHGAAWHFVLWGLLHGLIRVIEEMLNHRFGRLADKGKVWEKLCVTGNFLLLTTLWVFFRADTIKQAVRMLFKIPFSSRIYELFDGTLFTTGLDFKEMIVLLVALAILALVDVMKKRGKDLVVLFYNKSCVIQYIFFLLAIIVLFVFGVYGGTYDASQFIYFQF